MVFENKASVPIAILLSPDVVPNDAELPTAILLVNEVVPKVNTSKPIPILLFEPFVVTKGIILLPKAIFLKVVVADINEPEPIAIRF